MLIMYVCISYPDFPSNFLHSEVSQTSALRRSTTISNITCPYTNSTFVFFFHSQICFFSSCLLSGIAIDPSQNTEPLQLHNHLHSASDHVLLEYLPNISQPCPLFAGLLPILSFRLISTPFRYFLIGAIQVPPCHQCYLLSPPQFIFPSFVKLNPTHSMLFPTSMSLSYFFFFLIPKSIPLPLYLPTPTSRFS